MNSFWMKPDLSWRMWTVWQRDRDVYWKTFKVNFLPPLLEPILYLFALGFGLGAFVKEIQGIPYVQYIAPALVAISMMYNAFFECTYSSFVRMYYQKTFDAIIATPVSLDDVVMGEILWGATKALINATIVLVVVMAFRLVTLPHALLIIPFSFLAGLLFSAIAMFFTAVVPSIDSFNYPFYLFITPMFLFSGTFFPMDVLPPILQKFAWATLPLTHVVSVTRALAMGTWPAQGWASLLWMGGVTVLMTYLSLALMRRRLIV